MNRYITIPMVLLLVAFGTMCFNQVVRSSTEADSAVTANMNTIGNRAPYRMSSSAPLLDKQSAEKMVKEGLSSQESEYRRFSRMMVMPAEVQTVQFNSFETLANVPPYFATQDVEPQPDELRDSDELRGNVKFYLGSATLTRRDQTAVVPIAFNRESGAIYIHQGAEWVDHRNWYVNSAFEVLRYRK